MNIHSTTYSGKHKHKGYMKYYITSATLAIVLAGYFSINTPTTYVEDNKKVVIASIVESKPTFKDEILRDFEEQRKAVSFANLPSGQEAIQYIIENKFEKNLPMPFEQAKKELLKDSTLHVDEKGRMLYIDTNLPTEAPQATETAIGSVAVASVAVPIDVLKLHSLKGSKNSLYINFVGTPTYPPFSLDNLPFTRTAQENALIAYVHKRVADSYSPFDVDVTTEPPVAGVGKLGATILVTSYRNSSAGGIAYMNSFSGYGVNNPSAYCFQYSLRSNAKYISDCVAHELGHTVGLYHQGQLPSTAYYTGQGYWTPIMGLGYYKPVMQWSKGEYYNANNKIDSYAKMSTLGLKPRKDVVINTLASAQPLYSIASGGMFKATVEGIIKTPNEASMYAIKANAGKAVFTATSGGTAKVKLEVLNSLGVVISTGIVVGNISSAITTVLPFAGKYYIRVTGVGDGNPLKTGFSSYGSIGGYSLTATTM
jgi:hypothetical protein